MPCPESPSSSRSVLAAVRHWVSRGVIGLNLCPFAKSVYVKEQIRYRISEACDAQQALADLEQELIFLREADPLQWDTTLLIVPRALPDFLEYLDCLRRADKVLKKLRLQGVLQIASFHPHYQFRDREPGDIENHTNRAPYPIFHLLREDSLDRAVAAYPDAADIFERNENTMRRLGHEGWARWMAGTPQDEDG